MKNKLSNKRDSDVVQEMKRLVDEYKANLVEMQDKNTVLEVKLSEMEIENEVALRRADNAE